MVEEQEGVELVADARRDGAKQACAFPQADRPTSAIGGAFLRIRSSTF